MGAFFLHVLVHTLILVFVIPMFGLSERPPSPFPFKECGRRIACSWFSSNPVYCLRSHYIYQHDPPCDYCIVGKEHLLRVNEEIGLHFTVAPADTEDFDKPINIRGILTSLSKTFSDTLTTRRPDP